jgi:hypothetical protein
VVDLDRKLAAVALAHHGIITLADVLEAGGNQDYARSRVDAGRWEQVHRGVYHLAGAPFTYESEVFAAVCAAGKGAVVSQFCAARLHGIGFKRALVELTVPRGRFHRPKGIKVHTSTDLDRCDVVIVAGCIPVTDPDRTLLDMARRLKLKSHKKAIRDARRLELVDWHSLVITLAKHARRGRPGIKNFREYIVAASAVDGLTETDSEMVAVALLAEAGLPAPSVQHEVRARDGRIVARMDIAYVPNKTNFEIDGPIHKEPEVAAKDDERDHELRTRYGWLVRRIPHTIPLEEPRRFLAIVKETLALHPACDA